MLQKNLKTLKRSISAKILGRQKLEQPCAITVRNSSSTSSNEMAEEDPYREILRNNHDNVSHLVFHGSSVRSMNAVATQTKEKVNNNTIKRAPSP